jgi:hypothetical protein
MVSRLRKIAWDSTIFLLKWQHIYSTVYIYSHTNIHKYKYIHSENGSNGKQQLKFVCCKWKKWNFVFLGQQMINVNNNCCFSNVPVPIFGLPSGEVGGVFGNF